MKIQVLSDLHFEFADYTFKIDDTIDILILAGDISHIKDTEKILHNLSTKYSKLKIIKILGNHEYYDETINQTRKIASNINIPNIHILDNATITLNGIIFIGSTLWSEIKEYESIQYANDYNRIYTTSGKLLTPTDTITEFRKNKQYIEEQLEKYKHNKTILITHHLPSYKSIDQKYASSNINSAYASNMDDIILKYKPLLCIHGHTHSSVDYYLGSTRIICNPRGYNIQGKTENDKFNDQFVVEI